MTHSPDETTSTADPWAGLRGRTAEPASRPLVLWRWLPLSLVTGMLAAVIAGRVYHVALGFSRYAGVGPVVTGLYGLFLAALLAWSLDQARCRSRVLALLMGLVVGLGAFAVEQAYAYWDAIGALGHRLRLNAKMDFPTRQLIAVDPPSQWIEGRWAAGVRLSFGRRHLDLAGWRFGLVWLGQAALLAGLPAVLLGRHASRPICPHCQTRWESLDLVPRTPDEQALARTIEAADWAAVGPAPADDRAAVPKQLAIHVEFCPYCRGSGELRVERHTAGRWQTVLDHLPLGPGDLGQFIPPV